MWAKIYGRGASPGRVKHGGKEVGERETNGVERYRRGTGGRVKHVGKEVQERGSNRGKTWGREVEERCRWA